MAREEFFPGKFVVLVLVLSLEECRAVLGLCRRERFVARDLRFGFRKLREHCAHSRNHSGLFGSKVLCFERIVLVIVELKLGGAVVAAGDFPFDEPIAAGANGAANAFAAGINAVKTVLGAEIRIAECGHETFSFEPLRQRLQIIDANQQDVRFGRACDRTIGRDRGTKE